jgi:hypothetical protein
MHKITTMAEFAAAAADLVRPAGMPVTLKAADHCTNLVEALPLFTDEEICRAMDDDSTHYTEVVRTLRAFAPDEFLYEDDMDDSQYDNYRITASVYLNDVDLGKLWRAHYDD